MKLKDVIIAMLAVVVVCPAFADSKISQYPSGGSLQAGDTLLVVRSGANYQVPYAVPSVGVSTFNARNGAVTLSATDVGSILQIPATPHQFLTGLGSGGAFSQAQPAFSDLSGTVTAAQMPALTGDITSSQGAVTTTLATVNSNTGNFGSSTAIPTLTVNGKGLVTAASTSAVVAPAATLSGSTLAAGVTASSLTSVGTLTGLTVSGTATLGNPLATTSGGTGAGTSPAAYANLISSPTFYYTRTALAAAQTAGPNIEKFGFVGDSTVWGTYGNVTYRNTWVSQLAESLTKNHGIPTNTCAWIGDNSASLRKTADPRMVAGSSWTTYDDTDTTAGGGVWKATTNTNSLSFSCEHPVDTAVVYYEINGLGSCTINANGSSPHTLSESGSPASVGSYSYSVAKGYNTFNISQVSGTCKILGLYAYDSTQSQIIFFNLGWSGGNTANYTGTTNPWSPTNMIGVLGFNTMWLEGGPNDLSSSISTNQMQANLQALITEQQTVPGDVILQTGPPTSQTFGPHQYSSSLQNSYAQVFRTLGVTDSLPVIDIYSRWGGSATADGYALTAALSPAWYFDYGHGTPIGYSDYASANMALLSAQMFDGYVNENDINLVGVGTAGTPGIYAIGSDTNVGIALFPKNTASVSIGTTAPVSTLDNLEVYTNNAAVNSLIGVRSIGRNAGVIIDSAAANASTVDFYGAGSINGRIGYDNTTNSMRFYTNEAGSFNANERMRIDSSGNIAIGSSTANTSLTINNNGNGNVGLFAAGDQLQIIGKNGGPSAIDDNGFGYPPTIQFIRYDGTLPSSLTGLIAGDALGGFNGVGYNGTALSGNQASIAFFVGSTWSTSSESTYITFNTTPIGTTTRNEVGRFDTNGNLGIGTTAPRAALDVWTGTVTAAQFNVGASQIAFSNLAGNVTNSQLATQTANTVLGALTATTPSGLALPSCTDTSGNHLNYTSGTGFSCGTTSSKAGTVTSVTFTGDGTILSSTPSTAVTSSGTLTAALATQTANTVLGALTTTTPSGLSLPSCSTSASALAYTSGAGFSCNSSVNAATLGGATFASPGAIGGTSSSTGVFTSVGIGTATLGTNTKVAVNGGLAVGGYASGANSIKSNGVSATGQSVINMNASFIPQPIASGSPLIVIGVDATTTTIENQTFGAIPVFNGFRAQGTGASPSAVVATNVLALFGSQGYSGSGTTYNPAAEMRSVADATFSGSTAQSHIEFYTVPSASLTRTLALTIGNDQTLTVAAFGGSTATTVCQNSGKLSACTSSRRYKENIKDATWGLADVLRMRPVEFDWKEKKKSPYDQHDMGMIAEEVNEINPLFTTYKDGVVEGVKYTPFDALLVAAIKDQQKEIDELRETRGLPPRVCNWLCQARGFVEGL